MSSNKALFLVLSAVVILGNCMSIDYNQDFSNVQMHRECQDRDFCLQQTDNYPYELIDYLVKKTKLTNKESSSTEHRQGVKSESPCKVNNTNMPIYQIRDINKKVRFVVQTKSFEQRIRLEWCQNKGSITNQMTDLPFDVNQLKRKSRVASCEEMYTNYKFLVLSLDGRSLESVMVDEESIPVCCQCTIKDI